MLRIEALVRREDEWKVRETLEDTGVPFRRYELDYPDGVVFVCSVEEEKAERITWMLASTGKHKGGKIFICPMEEVKKVRPVDGMGPLFAVYALHPDPLYGEVLSYLDFEEVPLEDLTPEDPEPLTPEIPGGPLAVPSPA